MTRNHWWRAGGLLACLALIPTTAAAQLSGEYDFAISRAFLKSLYAQHSIETELTLTMNARTGKVHSLANDCEMHIAASPVGVELGDPTEVVAEPPNLCKNAPPGGGDWGDTLDAGVMNKDCKVRGYLRIFTEHASGSVLAANPNHVFEIHPALSIDCEGSTLDFRQFLNAPEGLRHLSASTANDCLEKRKLKVRYNSSTKMYEFRETGGRCGNFAIVEVGSVRKNWIRSIQQGGHSAIARVSANGLQRHTVKLYTFASTEADEWIAGLVEGHIPSERILVHGLFTYDSFSMVKTLRNPANGAWSTAGEWAEVHFPVALVVFGKTQTIPWSDDED